MAAINQTELMRALEKAVAGDSDEFIYRFMEANRLPKSTITQVRNGGTRNVAPAGSGDIAIKKNLYFHVMQSSDGDIFEYAETIKDAPLMAQHDLRFVIVTDFNEFVAYDRKAEDRLECPFNELPRHYSFFLPLAGYEKAQTHEDAAADIKAAEKMGKLCDLIRKQNDLDTPEKIHALNVFLSRLLFCLFAEDTGIFAKHQFTDALRHHTKDNDTAAFFDQLFAVLNNAERAGNLPAHFEAFPYVNGGLFRDEIKVPRLGPRGRRMILDSGTLDWSEINPDIFGSMFQSVIDPEQRGNLGQHYTSPSAIMRVLRPLFLDKLEDDLSKVKHSRKKLEAFILRLEKIKIADMACGSGNFLILAYKHLRQIEMKAFKALDSLAKQRQIFMSGIKLSQFYGIEIDDFAHEIAILALWLAEHQMNEAFKKEFGHSEPILPLKSGANIVLGNALRMDWDQVCPNNGNEEIYLCGNPPFLGANGRSVSQNEDMQATFSEHLPKYKYLDYVACFFWKAAQYIKASNAEVGMVATNSLCQGEQTAMLWPYLLEQDVSIHFAYQAFKWTNSAKGDAGVHVVIVGLTARQSVNKWIYKHINQSWQVQQVKNISPYLVDGNDSVVASRRKPFRNAQPMIFGNKPVDGGHLLLNVKEKESLISDNPEASVWVKRLLGADEYLNGKQRWCLWLSGISQQSLEEMPLVQERVNNVREKRLGSIDAGARKLADRPHEFRDLNNPDNFILVPCVTSERREYAPVGFFGSDVISTNLNQIIPNGTLYEFALLMSSMHMAWLRLVGGRLESRLRYSVNLVYNTFPWPDASSNQRKAIEQLADNILMLREDYYDWTMAQMYDPDKMPGPLRKAHEELDAAVEKLYRGKPFRDQAERQEYLLSQYEALLAEEQA